MKCFFCNSEMEYIVTSIETGWGEYDVTINGVKAHLCKKCDHEVYDPDEVNMIQNISQGLAENKNNEKPSLINVEETADLLRVSNQTIYNMIKDGRLQARKIGREWRFNRSEVESLIKVAGS